MKKLLLIFSLVYLPVVNADYDDRLNIFDAHIHYSHDVWQAIPAEEAIRRLKEVGVTRAMVSSTSDEGTQRLYEADPDFVIPVLRPYRKGDTRDNWMLNDRVISYLKDRLQNYRYIAIGEIHVKPENVNTSVVKQVVQLAREFDLILHVHGDARSVEMIFQQDPQAEILWAHAGFERASRVDEMLSKYSALWADLSFRNDTYGFGQFNDGWKELYIKHADRFMLGLDPYTPQRWLQIERIMQWQQSLLDALPEEVADKIAYKNGERVITTRFERIKKPN
jgi:hypothetical protein